MIFYNKYTNTSDIHIRGAVALVSWIGCDINIQTRCSGACSSGVCPSGWRRFNPCRTASQCAWMPRTISASLHHTHTHSSTAVNNVCNKCLKG